MPKGIYVDYSDLKELYLEQKSSSRQIAQIKGVDHCTISHALRRQGIPHRTLKEAITLSHLRGENHPNWKGGRRLREDGYVDIYLPEYPRARKEGYVLEHILVWEQTHGKSLPPGWIIHHLNGIKSDNRPENLVALSNKKHSLVLQVKAKRIQELEGLLRNQGQLL